MFTAIQYGGEILRWAVAKVVARKDLVSPTAELTQITLEFLELGVGELAMLCLACHVLDQPIGLPGDFVVLLGSRGTELRDERGGARLAETGSRDKRCVAPELLYLSGDGVESLAGIGPLGQDADTVAQIWGADLLQFTPDSRPLARGLGRDGVDEQQPWNVHQSIRTPNHRSTREGYPSALS